MCDRYNVLLIYDEVISGFGRTGTLFFAEQAGAWPDILCTGKGMSGGYAPLAATIINDKVASAFWASRKPACSSTRDIPSPGICWRAPPG